MARLAAAFGSLYAVKGVVVKPVLRPGTGGIQGCYEVGGSAANLIVLALAVLQHIPSFDLRLDVVRHAAALLRPDGVLAMSNW